VLALHVSELNGCSYCLSAHTLLAARAGASGEEAAAAREGQSRSRRERAILALGRRILRTGGARAGRELAEAREAGLTDGEILEVVAHVAARALTNATALLAETEIDFPKAPRLPSN
jgi:AhpD family alkylhydroperoxidase